MSGKVKITQEQADAIEFLKKQYNDVVIAKTLFTHENNWTDKMNCLNKSDTDTLLRALYIGYEVGEQFKVGDWVRYDNGEIHGYKTSKIASIEHFYAWFSKTESMPLHSLRHATPEEIAKEKERRWWAKHGREPWELKPYDILKNRGGSVFEVESNDGNKSELWSFKNPIGKVYDNDYLKRNFTVMAFASDRKDMQA